MSKLFGHSEPWQEMVPSTDIVNGNSYSMTAAFGLVELAISLLKEYNQPLTRSAIQAMAGTLQHIVTTQQKELSGSRSMQEGLNTRLRGALRTALEISDRPPFGLSAESWESWVDLISRRVTAIATAAYGLWADGPGETPWMQFVDTSIERKSA